MGSRAGLHEVSATAQCAGEVAERRRDECVIGPEQLHADRQRAAVVRDARLGIAAAVDGHGEVVQQRGDPRVIAAEALGRRGDDLRSQQPAHCVARSVGPGPSNANECFVSAARPDARPVKCAWASSTSLSRA